MTKYILAFLVCCTARADLAADYTAFLQKYGRKHAISGSLAAIRGRESFADAAGQADDDRALKNATDTLFPIASNSKEIVASAIVKLQEMGRLKVEDPVQKFIPEFPDARVTLTHLLQHTSGVADVYDDPEFARGLGKQDFTIAQILRVATASPLMFTPGSRFEYSNTGYLLLGEVVRRVSGMTLGHFLRRYLFAPNNLRDLGIGLWERNPDRAARAYEIQASGARADYMRSNGYTEMYLGDVWADGNVVSTAPELARWALALATGRVLNGPSTAQIFTPSQVEQYGFGWSVGETAGGRHLYSHWGGFQGFWSFVAVIPELQAAVVWLSNQEQRDLDLDQFARELIEGLGDEPNKNAGTGPAFKNQIK